MKRISICSWCGSPFDLEDEEQEIDVCGECNFYDESMIGEIDEDDLKFIKGEE